MKSISRKKILLITLLFVMFLSVAYAALTSSLNINGNTTFNSSKWEVYFSNIESYTDGQAVETTQASISEGTTISFGLEMKQPYDYYEVGVKIVNNGTIDAMINSIELPELTTQQEKLLDISVNYLGYQEVKKYDAFKNVNAKSSFKNEYGSSCIVDPKIYIRVQFKDDITEEDLPSSAINLNLDFAFNFVQADSNAKFVCIAK